jgi:hypothetical protein
VHVTGLAGGLWEPVIRGWVVFRALVAVFADEGGDGVWA